MLDAFRYLLCSKLCQHNRLVPTYFHRSSHSLLAKTTKIISYLCLLLLVLCHAGIMVLIEQTQKNRDTTNMGAFQFRAYPERFFSEFKHAEIGFLCLLLTV